MMCKLRDLCTRWVRVSVRIRVRVRVTVTVTTMAAVAVYSWNHGSSIPNLTFNVLLATQGCQIGERSQDSDTQTLQNL